MSGAQFADRFDKIYTEGLTRFKECANYVAAGKATQSKDCLQPTAGISCSSIPINHLNLPLDNSEKVVLQRTVQRLQVRETVCAQASGIDSMANTKSTVGERGHFALKRLRR